jgi:hypothetical protein
VRGQKTPDEKFWGMQNVVVVLQRPPEHGADPGQSLSVLQVHCPDVHVEPEPVQTVA